MGLRFRKSINLGGGLRLNISKRGIGISGGVRGARLSIGPRGIRTSAGIPGTGMYYTTQQSFGSLARSRARAPLYRQTVENPYLGVSKTIRAHTPEELKAKVEAQLATWKQREDKARSKKRVAEAKARAERMTQEARTKLEAYEAVLSSALDQVRPLDWESLLRMDEYPPFAYAERRPRRTFNEAKPTLSGTLIRLKVPRPSVVERFLPVVRERRLAAEARAKEVFEQECCAFQHRKEEAELRYMRGLLLFTLRRVVTWKQYLQAKADFERQKAEQNERIQRSRTGFEAGEPDAIREYFRFALSGLTTPYSPGGDADLAYDGASRTLCITMRLPAPGCLPSIVAYRYDSASETIVPKTLSERQARRLYREFASQSTLAVIYATFHADIKRYLSTVSVRATCPGIDPATGHPVDVCIVDVTVPWDSFRQVNLASVQPEACLRALGARLELRR